MARIVICDDNPLHLDRALALVRAAAGPNHDVRTCSDGAILLREIEAGESAPDIAVLDIELGEKNGIQIAGEINRLLPDCQIIFLTGYADYAPDAYTTEHVWFVLKERVNEHLPAAIKKALANLKDRSPAPDVLFRSDRKTYRLSLDELVYIERVGRKYRIVGRKETFPDVHLVSDLSDPGWKDRLIRCHQGYWVSEPRIYALDRNEIVLDNGERLPISRTFRDGVRERFFAARRL